MSKLGREFTMPTAVGNIKYNYRCHDLFENKRIGPKLHNIFGKTAGMQKGFIQYYSPKNRTLGYQWSKQRLYCLLGIKK